MPAKAEVFKIAAVARNLQTALFIRQMNVIYAPVLNPRPEVLGTLLNHLHSARGKELVGFDLDVFGELKCQFGGKGHWGELLLYRVARKSGTFRFERRLNSL